MDGLTRRRSVPATRAPSARLHLRRHVDLVRVASALCSL
ncbi:putative leader peptide [Nakamurella flava]